MYSVKEAFYTLQGEGRQAGRASVFCRFAGCNLWNGRERDRGGAICDFCDTDFVGTQGQNGGKFKNAEQLAEHLASFWPSGSDARPYVVFTGGEPALQLDVALINAMHQQGFEIAIETNGTLELAPGIDWICVSPKGSAPLAVQSGDELKLVYPQKEVQASPQCFDKLAFTHFYLQPLDNKNQAENQRKSVQFCLDNPQWKLSLQTHKILDID